MNTRIGIRVTPDERVVLEKAVKDGGFKNLSEFARKALETFAVQVEGSKTTQREAIDGE